MATQTINLGLIKDTPNEFYDVTKVNSNLDKIDLAVGELKEGTSIIEDLETTDKTLVGAINEIDSNAKTHLADYANFKTNTEQEIDTVKQSVSDGKQVVATAITGKGVPTSSSDTFQNMATNINAIETDNTGDATAVAGDILASKTAYANGAKLIGTIPSKGAQTYTPGITELLIEAGQYLSGRQTIAGVPVPVANVLIGTTIAGQVGTMPNNGGVTGTIATQGGSLIIPPGYHNGFGKYTANFPNLIPSTVKKNINIGGVVGTLVEKPKGVTVTTINATQAITNSSIDYTIITLPEDWVSFEFIADNITGNTTNGLSSSNCYITAGVGLMHIDFGEGNIFYASETHKNIVFFSMNRIPNTNSAHLFSLDRSGTSYAITKRILTFKNNILNVRASANSAGSFTLQAKTYHN